MIDDPCKTAVSRCEYGTKSHPIANMATHGEDSFSTCETTDVVKEVEALVTTVVDAVVTNHVNSTG